MNEKCFLCSEDIGDINMDEAYIDSGAGAFCDDCYEETYCVNCEGSGEVYVKRNNNDDIDFLDGSPTKELTNCDSCRGEGYKT